MVIVPSASSVPAVSSTGSAAITVALQQSTGGSTSGGTGTGSGAGTGSGSPCAACKFLRRKCQPDCVFAPYFPADNQQKFVNVHRVFGASNITKILRELQPCQREDAVRSLAYEADMRLHDPVHGCVGVISILQHRLRQVQQELTRATCELSKYHQAANETAAASMAMGSNGVAGTTDFVGNPVLNCTQNFINTGYSTAASNSGARFMQHDHFNSVQMLARSYGEEATTTRVGSNCGEGYASSAMVSGHGVVSGLGQIVGGGPFFKPGMAGEDEQHAADQ